MIYLITALDAEARPLIEHYRLKRDMSLPYTLYKNDDILLLVSGVGKTNALMALSALLGWNIPKPTDFLINIGICGAPCEYEIGEALLIHQIIDHEKRYYPDILYPHSLRETSLLCVNEPQSHTSELPVDMESAALFQAASRFFKLHQLAFVKIVSDHFTPEHVTKEGAIQIIASKLSLIDDLILSLKTVQSTQSFFSDKERTGIESFKSHFTKSQGDSLEDALCFFRLKNPAKPLSLPSDIPNSKRERSMLLEEYITTLTT